MEQKMNPMAQKPILPLLVSMSIPVVLSMFIQALYNIVDSIWVTRLGTDALTAVSLAFPLQNIVMSAGVGVGVGIGSVISMSLGAGDRETADKTASLGIAAVVVHCIIFAVLGLVVTKPFLAMFTDDPVTFKWACDYTYIVLCISFGELLQMCLEKIFQGLGKMKTTMFLMAAGCIINIVLDPIFIFGWLGFPAMGVKGAAIATVTGQIIAFVMYVVICLRKDIGVTIHPRFMKPDRAILKRIYSIGIPSSLMLAMPSIMVGVLNGILAQIDKVYVAVFGLYFKLQTFINMPANGVVQGMRPIISFNYGAGDMKRVRQTVLYSMQIVAGIMVIGTIGAVGFPGLILKAFDADAQLMEYGILAFRIIGLSFIFSTVGIVSAGVFEAVGKGRDSLIISLFRQFLIILPAGWVLSKLMGAAGIWITFPLAEIFAAVISVVMLRRDIISPQ
ncbi:MAG: MATE family efflux transporter [Eubacteriales bacterium]|nr:MATE family efflux transporter [Eubacteriales bacterium]